MIAEQEKQEEMLEARYFQNDIVATAFEIFEKPTILRWRYIYY